ncbi:FtsW/RodA/SpoVE family cell cycle protein [Porphyromonas sp.]
MDSLQEVVDRRSLVQRLLDGNGALWALYIAFMILSTLIVSSAISSEVYKAGSGMPIFKHILFLFGGFVLCAIVSQFSSRFMRNWAPRIMMLAMPLLIAWLLVAGSGKNGAERWIYIAGISVQPSELMRIALVLWGAVAAGNSWKRNPKRWKQFTAYYVLSGILIAILASSNLSTGIIFVLFIGIYSIVLRAPWRSFRWFVRVTIGLALLGGIALMTLPPSWLPGRASTWRARIERKVDEHSVAKGEVREINMGGQEDMGRMAIASSKNLLPVGPGQSKFRSALALAYSDYIYAIAIEEYGWLGLLVLPGLYVLWMWLILREARRQSSAYRANVLRGFAIIYPLQALVNLAVGAGLFNTGQTLPMFSFGGSSIFATSIAFGIMIGMSRSERAYKLWAEEQRQLEARRLAEEEAAEALERAEAPDEQALAYHPSLSSTEYDTASHH